MKNHEKSIFSPEKIEKNDFLKKSSEFDFDNCLASKTQKN